MHPFDQQREGIPLEKIALDYEILIDSVSEEDFEKLKEIDRKSKQQKLG